MYNISNICEGHMACPFIQCSDQVREMCCKQMNPVVKLNVHFTANMTRGESAFLQTILRQSSSPCNLQEEKGNLEVPVCFLQHYLLVVTMLSYLDVRRSVGDGLKHFHWTESPEMCDVHFTAPSKNKSTRHLRGN